MKIISGDVQVDTVYPPLRDPLTGAVTPRHAVIYELDSDATPEFLAKVLAGGSIPRAPQDIASQIVRFKCGSIPLAEFLPPTMRGLSPMSAADQKVYAAAVNNGNMHPPLLSFETMHALGSPANVPMTADALHAAIDARLTYHGIIGAAKVAALSALAAPVAPAAPVVPKGLERLQFAQPVPFTPTVQAPALATPPAAPDIDASALVSVPPTTPAV